MDLSGSGKGNTVSSCDSDLETSYSVRLEEFFVSCGNIGFSKWSLLNRVSYKSPGIDEIPAELIKAGGGIICGEIHKLITSVWKKDKLPEEWKESIIVPIHKKGIKQIVIIIGALHFCQQLTKFYLTSCCQG